MKIKIKMRTFYKLSLILLLLLLIGGCDLSIKGTVKEPDAKFEMPKCTVDAQLPTANSQTPPACPGEFLGGGGYGVNIEGGKQSYTFCRKPLEPWKTDPAKGPFTDLYMILKSGTKTTEKCASDYEDLGAFGKKLFEGLKIAGRLCGKYGVFPDFSGEATTPSTPTGGVISIDAFAPEPKSLCGYFDHCTNGFQDCDEERIDCGGNDCYTCPKLDPNTLTGNVAGTPIPDPKKSSPSTPSTDCKNDDHCMNGAVDCNETSTKTCGGISYECGPKESGCEPCDTECTASFESGKPFPGSLTLPLVEDSLLLTCTKCDTFPSCPEDYQDRGHFYIKKKLTEGSFWGDVLVSYLGFHGGMLEGGIIAFSSDVSSQLFGSSGKFITGQTFCVKYNLQCACREPDQCQAMCESGGDSTTSTSTSSNSPTASTTNTTTASPAESFAKDGVPGKWVRELEEGSVSDLTQPIDESPFPTLPPEVKIDGTADPYYTRMIKPDGTIHPLATPELFDKLRKGNCCLDPDECMELCTGATAESSTSSSSSSSSTSSSTSSSEESSGENIWHEPAKPMYTGIKVWDNPDILECGEKYGEIVGGPELPCWEKLMSGPCCGDDIEGKAWHKLSGGDCGGEMDDGAADIYPEKPKFLFQCVTDASKATKKWFPASEAAAGNGEDLEIYRPICQGGEQFATDEWHGAGKAFRLGPGIHRPNMDHGKMDCYWNYENNPGHDPVDAGFFGGALKFPDGDCMEGAGPYHRVLYCGQTDNDQADGGINYAVHELAHFGIAGITYCVHDNTFGKDLDGDAYPEQDCESFPIIRAKDGTGFPFQEEQLEENLKNTGSHCCGEVDDDEPYTPFDGEYYNDAGGSGTCFSSIYQPNGQYLKHTTHLGKDVDVVMNEEGDTQFLGVAYLTGAIQSGGLIAETDPTEEKGVFIFNGTHAGCKLDGPYDQGNDFLVDIADKPDPGQGGRANIFGGGFIDPTEGEVKVIQEQVYCAKTGPPEDITALYCSYTEEWLERNGTERDLLKNIPWDPTEARVADLLQPSGGPKNPARVEEQYFLTDNATNTSLLFLDQECCGTNQCWTGYRCLDDQADNPAEPPHPDTILRNGQAFRCIKGVWKSALLKYTPDGSESGYCPEDPQCLFDLEGNESQNGCTDEGCAPQCVNDGQYVKDDFCTNGDWTTRTRILAQIMLDKTRVETDVKDYTLFCDQPGIALNNPQNPGNTNNYCTLTFEDHVLLGTSYNGNRSNLFDALRQSSVFSYDHLDRNGTSVKEFGQTCSVADNFNECASLLDRDGKELVHVYHNGGLKMVVMSGKPAPGFDTSNPFTILWNFLKDLFNTILQVNSEPFVLTDFKQLYLSSLEPQRIHGIVEVLFSQNKSVNESKVFDQVFTLQYIGYNTDFNNLLGGVTAERKQIVGLPGDQTVIFLNPGQDIWPQFTEKLRPKRVEEPPAE